MSKRWGMAVVGVGLLTVGASVGVAQAPPPPGDGQTVDVEADPIRCWWRTSASAVRVGQPFTVVLTCAVVENETTTVVPDQSRLEPAALQLPPFEVIGGARGPDLHSDSRRFFQYQYSLRLINDEMFGKDAHIPSVQVNYNIESHVGRGEAVRGRDRTYLLPSESVRVLSLVPADATDIRDAPSWTFGDIEAQRFRARVFFVAAGVLFAAAALVAIVALLRLMRTYRQGGAVGRRLLSDRAVLRGVGRELAAVRRQTQGEGWTRELAGRALAALRVAGSVALGRPVGQVAAAAGVNGADGQLVMRGGLLRGRKALVSGSATAETVARALAAGGGSSGHRQALEEIQVALARFTTALFGRDEKIDETALGESLSDGFRVVRRLKVENLWLLKKYKGVTQFATEVGNRAWSR
ncbi:MAG: hypothetical protein ABI868_18770 [Acidobacteriota bacterium]